MGQKKVDFANEVTVYELPYELRYERVGLWVKAPKHDELWDGDLVEMREKELTTEEFLLLYPPRGKKKKVNLKKQVKRLSTGFTKIFNSLSTEKSGKAGKASVEAQPQKQTSDEDEAEDDEEAKLVTLDNYFSRLERMDGLNTEKLIRSRSKSSSICGSGEFLEALLQEEGINEDYAKIQASHMAHVTEILDAAPEVQEQTETKAETETQQQAQVEEQKEAAAAEQEEAVPLQKKPSLQEQQKTRQLSRMEQIRKISKENNIGDSGKLKVRKRIKTPPPSAASNTTADTKRISRPRSSLKQKQQQAETATDFVGELLKQYSHTELAAMGGAAFFALVFLSYLVL